jgi:hypothetical protein
MNTSKKKRKRQTNANDNQEKKQKVLDRKPKKIPPKSLLESMTLNVTGIPPDPSATDPKSNATARIVGVRDSTKGCCILYRGPAIPPRSIHLDSLFEDERVAAEFLQRLSAVPEFAKMSIGQRQEWLRANQQPKELSLAVFAPAAEVKILEVGEPTGQLAKRIPEKLLDEWTAGQSWIPIGQISDRLSLKNEENEENEKKRNLFFLHDWWKIDYSPTIISRLDNNHQRYYLDCLDGLEWNYNHSVEHKNDGISPPLPPDIYLCGPKIAIRNHFFKHVEHKQKVEKEEKGFEPAIPFSFYKSHLQKLIRYQPRSVFLPDTNKTKLPALAHLRSVMRQMAAHKGCFLPEIGKFVSGLESLCKRLAVIGFEDSCILPEDAHFLLVCAILAKYHRLTWKPSPDVLGKIYSIGEQLYANTRCYDYSTKKRAGLDLKGATDSKTGCVAARCSVLLDELGSFEGDKNMVRCIAAHPKILDSTKNKCEPFSVDMNLEHSVDQHCFPNIGYLMTVVDMDAYPGRVPSKPFSGIYAQIFSQVNFFFFFFF